jgi:hypothetical protein
VYVNRKSWYSINVQLMCNSDYKITNVVARWPGSTHDSRVLRNSSIGQKFERGELDGLILGDSGYALQPWLMTPFLNPSTPGENAYNRYVRPYRMYQNK